MTRMFYGLSNFTSDLSSWDVSNVENMTDMFNGASSFTSNLSNWDVSNLMDMGGMFQDATSFDSDLSGWDVSSVATFENTFNNTGIADSNKCAIHQSWLVQNDNWSYDWLEYCNLSNQSDNLTPKNFSLHQNYPNPFNPTTKIIYELPNNVFVNVDIYNVMGHVVKNLINSKQEAGLKFIHWDATDNRGEQVPAGMYLYTIQAGEYMQTRKMVLLK